MTIAQQKKNELMRNFFWKGIVTAIMSGICYALFTAFVTLGMSYGVWEDWYGDNGAGLSMFTIMYLLGALGAAMNDSISALWSAGIAQAKGKARDFLRSVNSRPGRTMVFAALCGGPIASTAYIAGLQLAGTIIVPITALCPAIGAIISRVVYKQPLTPRMMCGIAVCVLASFMIGTTGIGDDVPEGLVLGLCIAFIAALGWGIEGCVAGYGTSMIDYEIGIMIRQTTSGLSNLIILLPLFAIIAGDFGLSGNLLGQALSSGASMPFFIVSGFFALFAFSLWYKGNSMCGTALGMACNGMYSFWTPLICWIILGLIAGFEGFDLPPIAWAAAVLMSIGIFLIAVNPLEVFKKKEVE